MAKKVGYAAKLYGGAAGSTPTTEITHVTDCEVSVEIDVIDATDRSTGGWKDNLTALKDAALTFTLIFDDTDTNYSAIRSAAIGGSAYAFKAATGSGGAGLDADWTIKSFKEKTNKDDVIAAEVECVPYCGTRNPSWTTGSNS